MLLVTNFICGLQGGTEESVVVGFYKVTQNIGAPFLFLEFHQIRFLRVNTNVGPIYR